MMFPEVDNYDTTENNIISDSSKIRLTPNYNYNTKDTVLIDGSPDMICDVNNVKQWIIKFLRTPIDIKEIYHGTGFGTSAYLAKGYKFVDGLLFAQIKKEIEEGFLLNPNIIRVLDCNVYKEDKTLMIYVKVKLIDGTILEETTEIWSLKL